MDKFKPETALSEKSRKDLGERVMSFASELGIDEVIAKMHMDHFCVRTHKDSDTEALKQYLTKVYDSSVISEAQINGRTILIYRLKSPLQVKDWNPRDIEVPHTNGKTYRILDHAEWELGIKDPNVRIDDIRHAVASRFGISVEQLQEISGYDESEPNAEADQLPNPTISLKGDNVTLKFHAYGIGTVVGEDSLEG